MSGTFKGQSARVIDGWAQIDKDGYYVLQCSPSLDTKVFFNDSLLLHADAEAVNMRPAIILPLRTGKYSLRIECPMDDPARARLDFGMYFSKNGQDD